MKGWAIRAAQSHASKMKRSVGTNADRVWPRHISIVVRFSPDTVRAVAADSAAEHFREPGRMTFAAAAHFHSLLCVPNCHAPFCVACVWEQTARK